MPTSGRAWGLTPHSQNLVLGREAEGPSGEAQGLEAEIWVGVPAPPLTGCVPWREAGTVAEHEYPPLLEDGTTCSSLPHISGYLRPSFRVPRTYECAWHRVDAQ